ncbi:MAG: class I tRNA ligase family protein, partial [Nitrospiraceae bacterium]
MLTIYNTLTGRKEPFQSLVPKTVRMYVCGVTVYDYCHLGHARSALVFDMIRRYLEFAGYTVEFVKNFTDVDDKIIKRANEEGVSCEEITT